MKVGIIGSGVVGQALGLGFVSRGHEAKLGTRDPGKDAVRSWIDRAQKGATGAGAASAGTFADAASFGELLVVATLFTGTESALRLAEPKNFVGKVVMDTTNPLAFGEQGPPTLTVGHHDSAGEQVQRWLPGARVVKVFNTIGSAHMIDPKFPGGTPDMFLAGNDDAAKKEVADIVKSFGWPGAIDLGGLEASRYLEPLAMVWIAYGFRNGSWNHGFKLLKK